MKVFIGGEHVKTIPKKYEVIRDVNPAFTDFTKKRLLDSERKALDHMLFLRLLEDHVAPLMKNPTFAAYIGNDTPQDAVEVSTRDDIYHAIRDTGGQLLKCSFTLYSKCNDQNRIKRL